MAKRIFVSYNFNDRQVTETVKHMIETHHDAIEGRMVFVENDVSYNGATAINWEIEQVMDKCDAALFVLGDNVRNSPWLAHEADQVKARNIPAIATCLPGISEVTTESLHDLPCTMVNWNTTELPTQLNLC